MEPLFTEEQRFSQLWVWASLGVVALIPFYGIFQQLILGKPFGNNPMSDTGLIVLAASILLPLILLSIINLKTTIDEEKIRVRMRPFTQRTFVWSEIEEAEVLDYGFVGGWGWRFGTKYGTVYNTSGSKGLALRLKDGSKYLIGTQRPQELDDILREHGLIEGLQLKDLAPEPEKEKIKLKRK